MTLIDPQNECTRHFATINDFYRQIDFHPDTDFDNWLAGEGAWSRPHVQLEVAADMATTLELWLDECDRESRRVVLGAIDDFLEQAGNLIQCLQKELHDKTKAKFIGRKYAVNGMPGWIATTEFGLRLYSRCFGPSEFVTWGDVHSIEPA